MAFSPGTPKTVVILLWGKCEDEIHIPKSGNLESSGTPATSELDYRGQNTSPWGVLYIIKKALKCRCENGLAWAIRTSVAQVMVERRAGSQTGSLTPDHKKSGINPTMMCVDSVKIRWRNLEENYKIALDLIPIRGLNWELWAPKVPKVQTRTVLGLLLGSLENKSHLDVGSVEQRRKYYMGEGGGFPRVRAVVSQVSPRLPVACPNTKRVQNEF
jgi:hypothetical protein